MEALHKIWAWEKIVKNSLDIICTVDDKGFYLKVNEACQKVLGFEESEMQGHHFSEFVHPDDLNATINTVNGILNGQKVYNFQNRCVHKEGREVPVIWSAVWSDEDKIICCIGRDATDQQKVKEKEELHKALVENGADMMAMFDKDMNFLYCGSSTERELGYKPEQLIGTNVFEYIHPDDIPMIRELLSGEFGPGEYIKTSQVRFRNARGEWRWLEATLSNQLENPAVKALVSSSRDITDRLQQKLKLEESEQRFKSLFDHHPDLVLYQNREGLMVDINAAALAFLGVPTE